MKTFYNIENFNQSSHQELQEHLYKCCGSHKWISALIASIPFATVTALLLYAEKLWLELAEKDVLHAFDCHPKIGDKEKIQQLSSEHWSRQEQKSMETINNTTAENFKKYNHQYFQKFGFIYIICAHGKNPEFMLHNIQKRLNNTRNEELYNAKLQHNEITQLRLQKLFKH